MAETAQAASKRSTVTVSGYESGTFMHTAKQSTVSSRAWGHPQLFNICYLFNTGSPPPDMLSDLTCKIPDLLCYLSEAASLQSILATSSALRQQVHQHVTKVTAGQRQPQQDLAVLVKGYWPCLVHVCSCGNAPKCCVQIPNAESWMAQPSQLHNQLQSIDFNYSQMTSRSVLVLLTASFRQLLSLRLMSCKLETQCPQALSMSQLPSLQTLDLSDIRLGAAAVAHILHSQLATSQNFEVGSEPGVQRRPSLGYCKLAIA